MRLGEGQTRLSITLTSLIYELDANSRRLRLGVKRSAPSSLQFCLGQFKNAFAVTEAIGFDTYLV